MTEAQYNRVMIAKTMKNQLEKLPIGHGIGLFVFLLFGAVTIGMSYLFATGAVGEWLGIPNHPLTKLLKPIFIGISIVTILMTLIVCGMILFASIFSNTVVSPEFASDLERRSKEPENKVSGVAAFALAEMARERGDDDGYRAWISHAATHGHAEASSLNARLN